MKNTKEQSQPIIVIIDKLADGRDEKRDKKTFEIIEANIVEPTKLREFDCLFLSIKRSSAKELSRNLRKNHRYKTDKPYQDEDGWINHAVKQILFSDLKDNLKIAREVEAKQSSELIDWNIEVDPSPEGINSNKEK